MICSICPRRCGAERTETEGHGSCRMPAAPVVARAALHPWEEPVLCGNRGAGTVFFSGCNLGCVYCQNHAISRGNFGRPVTSARLREIFLDLIAQGAATIDLVTPTHFVPLILPALDPPLPVPVVYNCGGYESVETLRLLEGKVQVYLPDLKYADAELARRLSAAPDYFSVATAAIREMLLRPNRPLRGGGWPPQARRPHPPPGAAGTDREHPPLSGLDRRSISPRGGAGVSYEPVYTPAWGGGRLGPTCDRGGIPRRCAVYGKLRHHRRLYAGAHIGPGGVHPGL